MFTKSQIEAARYTLRTPFDHPESEAMRKIALWLLDHAMPIPLPPTKKVRKARKPRRTYDEAADIILSDDPPSVLMERYGVTLGTINHYKSGHGNYKKFEGCSGFWKEYRRKHRAEIRRLTKNSNDNQKFKEAM
ncbi:hypothetical protein H261_21211 [Paramagnetospirillum caucaseum]|uniref:Uncharacterized protein n=1 Tax=Paramagnetospirillum caucaseum TaxID=1244869 RepID=M2Z0S0_9PROT|nr:hypothetical protein [Paramagnetospirillum caucaseum]EME67880.1 hypothetical protein H261_21211 [Paramagnetospirillum caucaseum]